MTDQHADFEANDDYKTGPKATPNEELRRRIARAIHRYDNHHALSGNDIPSKHHLGEADFVLAELRAELGALAALRAVARGYCPACGRGDAAPSVEDWEQQRKRADQLRTRMNTLADRWDIEGPPPGNRPLTELRAAIAAATCETEETASPTEPSLYEKIVDMFGGPLPPPADAPPATALPCNHAHLRQPHAPHEWQPQPGMRHVQCPGYAPVPAPAEATDTTKEN